MRTPLVSIIIVVLRDRDELSGILDSIFRHGPYRESDVEVIVIDGGSTDGTVELLESFGDRVGYWLSERDTGIYDAMNKGVRAARGEYLLHLNAGDRLRMLPLDALRQCATDNIDVVNCRVLMDGVTEFVSRTGWLLRIDNTWHHQGTFYRRAAHLGYDPGYRIVGDFHLNQRLLRSGCRTRQLDYVVADHRSDGRSASTREQDFPHGEMFRSIFANYGWAYALPALLRFKLNDVRRWWRRRRLPAPRSPSQVGTQR